MTNTLTKVAFGFIVAIAIFMTYLSFTSDIYEYYDVDNTTGHITELNDVVDSSMNKMENYSKSFSESVQGVEQLNFVGVIVGTIVNAVKLPFEFIYMILKLIVTIFSILSLPIKIMILIVIVLSIIISIGILKVILGRSDL